MNILVVDLLSPEKHKKFNSKMIFHMKQVAHIEFLCSKRNEDKQVKNFFFPEESQSENILYRKLNLYLKTLYAFKMLKKNNYDVIYFITYDSIATGFYFLLHKQKNKILVHEHKNIDEVNKSFIKRAIYKNIKITTHIVYEKYFGQFIKEKYNKNFHVISHPTYEVKLNDSNIKSAFIFSPSANIDKKYKNDLIAFCRKNRLKIILKDEKYFKDKFVTKSNFFDNYYDLINKASYIFISNDFQYRASGVMYEALSMNKKIICTKSYFAKKIKESYPENIFIIEDVNEILSLLDKQNDLNDVENNDFNKKHSDEVIMQQYKSIFESLQ
tara:strand:- start:3509 stop:4489 length:981 start_codon:yes stop_codon:yes gene_type:complete